MKKRGLIFSLVYLPRFVGGAEVAVHEITKRSEDVEFDMVTLRMDSRLPSVEQVGNIMVHRIGYSVPLENVNTLPFSLQLMKFLFPFLAFWKARCLHRKHRYDFIWSIMASYNSFGALFFKWCYPSVSFLLTLQEGDPLKEIKRKVFFVYPVFRKIFTTADMVQPISEYLARFAKDMGVKKPIVIIPNAVDVEAFTQNHTDADLFELKEELGKKYTDKYLITTGRLVVKNGVGDIITALTMLPPEVKLLVVGTGFMEGELKSLAQSLGVQDRVKFLGFIEHTFLPKYLHVSDVFIRPSLSEGFGNSFIEAMAAKLPVIATPVGGIPDFLEDRKTGIFCRPSDPKSIARAVELVLGNSALAKSVVSEAYEMVVARYDWSKISRDMNELIFKKL